MKKHIVKKIIGISLLALLMIAVTRLLLFPILKLALHLDFSQEYRRVEADKIRFRDKDGKVYGRAFWGLRAKAFEGENVSESREDGGLWYGYDAKEGRIFLGHLVGEIEEAYDTQYSVSQITLSPDARYLLFCEIEYGVNGGYSTDEEYCYYRVIDRETGEQYTIYSGYREWYQVYWEKGNFLEAY